VVASSLDLDARSVDVHLRNLREAGLISKEKRGRGAARVTAVDAAALLVAVMGSQFVKDTIRTYRDFGLLKRKDRRVTLSDGESRLRSAFQKKLPLSESSDRETVLDVLSAVLASDLREESFFREKGFFPEIRPEDFTKRGGHSRTEYEPFLSVRFFAPSKGVAVEWGGSPLFRDARQYGDFPAGAGERRWDLRLPASHSGMVTVRSIGLPAAAFISAALRSN
jgi:DNA-binding transcriptional ArsR family regulator